MTNPYIYAGARVRYRGLRALEYVVDAVQDHTGAIRLYGQREWQPAAMFKPVVSVKMGRRELVPLFWNFA